MDLFVCATAYQLLNAIAITKQEKIIADVIITHSNMDVICNLDHLSRQKIFNYVYLWYDLTDSVTKGGVKDKSDNLKLKLKKAGAYFQKRKNYNSLPNSSIIYERIFVGYDEIPTEYVFYWFKKKGASLQLYDEGTYTYKCLGIRKPLYKRIVSQLLFGGQLLDNVEGIWVRNTNAVDIGSSKIVIHEITNTFTSAIGEIEQVFKGSFCLDDFKAPIIFLDQYFSDYNCDFLQKEIVAHINSRYGRNSIVTKLHPSTMNDKYGENVKIVKTRVPFEVLISSIDIDNKVLIAIYSSACFTPKLLFNREPKILFLYKMANLDSGNFISKEYFEEVDNLKETYSDSKKVVVIEDKKELFAVLDEQLGWGGVHL